MNKPYVYIALVCVLFIASCPNPTKNEKNRGGTEDIVRESVYSFAFAEEEVKVARTVNTYTKAVGEENKPVGDDRTLRYSSSSNAIATVDDTGLVTFITAGTLIITATKEAKGDYEEVSDTYTLYITTKPANKDGLIAEIKSAMAAHGNDVDLNYIDTSAITDMSELFSRYEGYALEKFSGDISQWDVSSVTTMKDMFLAATDFNSDLSKWTVSNVTNMYRMFSVATSFSGDISKWDVSKVTTMYSMFSGATAFNRDISRWDISSVTIMSFMFHGATAFTQNLNCWVSRINLAIKNNWMGLAEDMFEDSGLADTPPSWYKTTDISGSRGCPAVNPKDGADDA